jgi:hypothetical protein
MRLSWVCIRLGKIVPNHKPLRALLKFPWFSAFWLTKLGSVYTRRRLGGRQPL